MAITTKFFKTDNATIVSDTGTSSTATYTLATWSSSSSFVAVPGAAWQSNYLATIVNYPTLTSSALTTSTVVSSIIYTVPSGRTAKVIFNPGILSDLISATASISPNISVSYRISVQIASYVSQSGFLATSVFTSLSYAFTNTIAFAISINNYKIIDSSTSYVTNFTPLIPIGSAQVTWSTGSDTYTTYPTYLGNSLYTTAPAALLSTNNSFSRAGTLGSSFFMGPGDSLMVLGSWINTVQLIGSSAGFKLSYSVSGTSGAYTPSVSYFVAASIVGSLVQIASASLLRTSLFGCLVIEESAS